jgi:hypothetical protein
LIGQFGIGLLSAFLLSDQRKDTMLLEIIDAGNLDNLFPSIVHLQTNFKKNLISNVGQEVEGVVTTTNASPQTNAAVPLCPETTRCRNR